VQVVPRAIEERAFQDEEGLGVAAVHVKGVAMPGGWVMNETSRAPPLSDPVSSRSNSEPMAQVPGPVVRDPGR